MRARTGVTFAFAVAAVGAIAAAQVVAGGEPAGPGQRAMQELTLKAERVPAPSGGEALAARGKGGRGRGGVKLIYLETSEPQTFEPGPTGATVQRCPGKSKVLNGYYFVRDVHQGFGLDDQGGSPSRVRKWSFYLNNETQSAISGVILGMICVKPA